MRDDRVSSTALTVLQGILYTSEREKFKHLVSKEIIEACRAILLSTDEGKKRLKQLDSRVFKAFVPIIEKLMLPGITLHYVLRKKAIEEYVRDSISKGFTQVVSLGAGFDSLAYRLSKEFDSVNFIEIDHSATQIHKREALVKEELSNLNLLSVDFAKENLKDKLKNFENFDKDRETIFISEGVLMYLPRESVEELFNSLKELVDSKMEFIFTFIEPMRENRDSYGILLNLYLKFKSENLFWSIKKDELSPFLKNLNYEMVELIDTDKFKERYLKNIDVTMHRGEVIAIAK